jgi:hypothetical protein
VRWWDHQPAPKGPLIKTPGMAGMAGCVCGDIGTAAGVDTASDTYDSMPELVSGSSTTDSDDDTPPPREQTRSTDSDPEVNHLQGLNCVLCSVPRLWCECPFVICQMIPRMLIGLRMAIMTAGGNPRRTASQGVRRHGICCSLSRRHAHPPHSPPCMHAGTTQRLPCLAVQFMSAVIKDIKSPLAQKRLWLFGHYDGDLKWRAALNGGKATKAHCDAAHKTALEVARSLAVVLAPRGTGARDPDANDPKKGPAEHAALLRARRVRMTRRTPHMQ